jgi:hypothetical protein
MVGSEIATLARIEPFWSWNTPIAWTGFILFADAVVWRARGSSWLRGHRPEFVALALVSIPLWLVFEGFNQFIENWHYVGLPERQAVRCFGYAWSFATIWPAIFEGAELVALWRRSAPVAPPREARPLLVRPAAPDRALNPLRWLSVAAGAAMLLLPLILASPYLAAPVFLGFIFLLDPINRRLGAESLGADLGARRYDRLINLAASGLLCGVLWEFWNYWARTKWRYTVPIMADAKLFEMPLPGYVGFSAFALECFTMYEFVRAVARRWVLARADCAPGRRIGL